jgi:hypothetical protein
MDRRDGSHPCRARAARPDSPAPFEHADHRRHHHAPRHPGHDRGSHAARRRRHAQRGGPRAHRRADGDPPAVRPHGGAADARAQSQPPRRHTAQTALSLYREDEFTRSELEQAFLALCDAHGIPRPLVNHLVEGEEVDFVWPEQRLIVETDGRGTHLTHEAFERDRARDARLLVLGYRVLRFTELQVRLDGSSVAQTLRAVLAAAAVR